MLKSLRENGTRFVVAGRLNKASGLFEKLDVSIVPEGYGDMFSALQDFRNDISSTELRAAAV